MAVTFLPYGMVVYSHEMGERSTLCYVANRGVLGRSAEAKPSFMTLGSADASDYAVFANEPAACRIFKFQFMSDHFALKRDLTILEK